MEEPRLRPDGLQLEEHRRFQKRFWKIERIAWVAFAIVTVAALLGLTGAGGPLATASAESSNAVISYPRVARWETADELQIAFRPRDGVTERMVTLSPAFAKAFQLEDVQPEPSETTISDRGQILIFGNADSNGGLVTMHIRAQSVGRNGFSVTVDGDASTALTTYVLP
ncbi:hypothetical protein ACQKKX_07460 [Neorhizobium sp. NPDC001467]|uniref:hypothetical protein n=1 Tax=Neorhizobium sp. NPDC001467 TaxID=3390595 RepID=UPI003D05D93A